MIKLKTMPNMGTRKLTLPFVGEVQMVDGVFEVEESFVKDLTSCQCGFRITPIDYKVEKGDTGGGEDELDNSEKVTKESLLAMRIKDLDEIFNQLKEETEISEGEVEDYQAMKKAERIEFLYKILNAPAKEENAE